MAPVRELQQPLSCPGMSGRNVALSDFDASQYHQRYLGWLNDREVNRFSRRGGIETTECEAREYLENLGPDEFIAGIWAGANGHVGNLKVGPVDWGNQRADISILIGERSVWGKGIGAEAVYLITKYMFEGLGLNRLDAGTVNPGFSRMVEKLGWTHEGTLRERVHIDGRFHDSHLYSILSREFARRPEFEPTSRQDAK